MTYVNFIYHPKLYVSALKFLTCCPNFSLTKEQRTFLRIPKNPTKYRFIIRNWPNCQNIHFKGVFTRNNLRYKIKFISIYFLDLFSFFFLCDILRIVSSIFNSLGTNTNQSTISTSFPSCDISFKLLFFCGYSNIGSNAGLTNSKTSPTN